MGKKELCHGHASLFYGIKCLLGEVELVSYNTNSIDFTFTNIKGGHSNDY
jgi:hypothetical protein